jgi:hypothetical protein
MPAGKNQPNHSVAKDKSDDAGAVGTKAKVVLGIGTVIGSVTAVSPTILALQGKVALEKIHKTEGGAWEGGFLFVSPELLQGFTGVICAILLGFTFVKSDWLHKKWGMTRVAIASLLVTVASFGIFGLTYWVIAEPELKAMAALEEKAASQGQGEIARLSVMERLKEKGGSFLRDTTIGWFYLWFFVGLSQLPMLLALIEYHAQTDRAKKRAPRIR